MMDDDQAQAIGAALAAAYDAIWRGPMQEMPICNPALEVEAVGFRAHGDWAIGIVVTPWFMNIVAVAGSGERPHPTPPPLRGRGGRLGGGGDSRTSNHQPSRGVPPSPAERGRVRGGGAAPQLISLPAGDVAFARAALQDFGPLLSCSLFSPMFDFADMATARQAADEAMSALFNPALLQPPQPDKRARMDRRALLRGDLA
jgi:hypothetical protein